MRWWPRRREQLVVVRRYAGDEAAEAGWAALMEADIPATLVADPGALGSPTGIDLMVARAHLDAARTILGD